MLKLIEAARSGVQERSERDFNTYREWWDEHVSMTADP
jgi:hypothetical protein